MRTIDAKADTDLPSLLGHVERGETIVITRDGQTIARIVPDKDPRQADVGRVLAEIDAFRKSMPRLTLDELLTWRHEGHDR